MKTATAATAATEATAAIAATSAPTVPGPASAPRRMAGPSTSRRSCSPRSGTRTRGWMTRCAQWGCVGMLLSSRYHGSPRPIRRMTSRTTWRASTPSSECPIPWGSPTATSARRCGCCRIWRGFWRNARSFRSSTSRCSRGRFHRWTRRFCPSWSATCSGFCPRTGRGRRCRGRGACSTICAGPSSTSTRTCAPGTPRKSRRRSRRSNAWTSTRGAMSAPKSPRSSAPTRAVNSRRLSGRSSTPTTAPCRRHSCTRCGIPRTCR